MSSVLLRIVLSGSALIMLIAALRKIALQRLPKVAFLILWELTAVRLLMPGFVPVPILSAAPASGEGILLPGATLTTPSGPLVLPGAEETVEVAASVDWSAILLAVWLLGAAALAAYFVRLYLRSMEKFRASLPEEAPLVKSWLAMQRLCRPLAVRQSDQVSAPLTYGIFRPVILLPAGLAQELGPDGLTPILTHELVHIRRFDSGAKLVFAAVLCVHWWNPLVWLLYILAGRDMELSCDEAALRILGGRQQRAAYARTLLGMEQTRTLNTSLYSQFSGFPLEERIQAIMNYKKMSAASAVLAAALILGSVTAFADAVPKNNSPKNDAPTVQTDVLSLRSGATGGQLYSTDGGITWLTQEACQAQAGQWQVQWWTPEEYRAWLEQEKQELAGIIGSQGWTPSTGWFTWDQAKVDETVALYEQVLEKIQNGALVSKQILDENGQEITDVALGSGTALGTVVTSTYEEHDAILEKSLDQTDLIASFKQFGVDGNMAEGLTYQGQPIRILVDAVSIIGGDGYAVQYVYRNERGTVDVHTLRSAVQNQDGSANPVGNLIGMAAKGDPAFDQAMIDSAAFSDGLQVTAVMEKYVFTEAEKSTDILTEAIPETIAQGTETDEGVPMPDMFQKYTRWGLAYQETTAEAGIQRSLTYQGQWVNHFADITPYGGVFTFGSSEQRKGGITVRTVYDENGSLVGLTSE